MNGPRVKVTLRPSGVQANGTLVGPGDWDYLPDQEQEPTRA